MQVSECRLATPHNGPWYASGIPVAIEFSNFSYHCMASMLVESDRRFVSVSNARGQRALVWRDPDGFKEIQLVYSEAP